MDQSGLEDPAVVKLEPSQDVVGIGHQQQQQQHAQEETATAHQYLTGEGTESATGSATVSGDFSSLMASGGEEDENHDGEEQAPKSFPQKLMEILSDENNHDVVNWLPHGNGFIIHKKKTFAQDILPRFFKASKFTSFTRKLNRWGFSRVPRGPETGAYFHKLFRRDQPDLCLQMTSNSGNKYSSAPLQQQLLPNVAAMNPGGVPFPYMPNPMMTPQQQQVLWQQQVHMQMMQMQMMQMQQSQAQGQNPQALGVPVPALAPMSQGHTGQQMQLQAMPVLSQAQPESAPAPPPAVYSGPGMFSNQDTTGTQVQLDGTHDSSMATAAAEAASASFRNSVDTAHSELQSALQEAGASSSMGQGLDLSVVAPEDAPVISNDHHTAPAAPPDPLVISPSDGLVDHVSTAI